MGAVSEKQEHYDLLTIVIICLGEEIEQGVTSRNIYLIREKSRNGLDIERISEHLELEESYVEQVIEVIRENAGANDLEIVKFMKEKEIPIS